MVAPRIDVKAMKSRPVYRCNASGWITKYKTNEGRAPIVRWDGVLASEEDKSELNLASIEAKLSESQERTALTNTTHAWLLSLRRRLAEVEEDTPEAFGEHRQLVRLLVESISLGKRQEDGQAESQITYRFGPPPASDAQSDNGLSMSVLRNGSETSTPDTSITALTVVAVR